MCGADVQGRSEVGFRIEFKQGSVLSITDIGDFAVRAPARARPSGDYSLNTDGARLLRFLR